MTPSNVAKNLWVGSYPLYGQSLLFDRLIFCAKEFQPKEDVFCDVPVFRVPLPDDDRTLTPKEWSLALQAGRVVSWWMRQDKRVLVTGWSGWNRSGLISAIALVTDGMSADAAIKKVRAARGPNALSNPHFVRLLERVYDASELCLAV